MALQSSTETSSGFIPFILHEEIQDPSFPSSTSSTFRRQRALRLILHAEGKEIFYPVYKTLQRHSRHSSHKTFQRHSSSSKTFQTFQSFMTFQSSRHYYTFQHFFNQNAYSTHQLVSTRNFIEYQSKTFHKLTFFKEREMLRYRS